MFAVLSLAACWALIPCYGLPIWSIVGALAGTVLFGALTEYGQKRTWTWLGRHGTWEDVLVDFAGAVIGVYAFLLWAAVN